MHDHLKLGLRTERSWNRITLGIRSEDLMILMQMLMLMIREVGIFFCNINIHVVFKIIILFVYKSQFFVKIQ